MNWIKKISQVNVSIQIVMDRYVQSMSEYIYELSQRSMSKAEQLKNFKLNRQMITQSLSQYPNFSVIENALNTNDMDAMDREFVPLTKWVRANSMNNNTFQAYMHLRDYLESVSPFIYSEQEAQQDIDRLSKETHGKMQSLAGMIQESANRTQWSGSPVFIYPKEPADENGTNWLVASEDANVYVGDNEDGNSPMLEVFLADGKYTIPPEGIVEDDDFFSNPDNTRDYFNLIKEINNPGSSNKSGKTLTLYTARPSSDREMYMNATTVPGGIYLTSSENDAVDLSVDFGGKRDIWKVRIDERYVQKMLDMPQFKHYQVMGREPVPVKSITFFYAV